MQNDYIMLVSLQYVTFSKVLGTSFWNMVCFVRDAKGISFFFFYIACKHLYLLGDIKEDFFRSEYGV